MKLSTFRLLFLAILKEASSKYNTSYFGIPCINKSLAFEKDEELNYRTFSTALVLKSQMTLSFYNITCDKIIEISSEGNVLLSIRILNFRKDCKVEYLEITTIIKNRVSSVNFCKEHLPKNKNIVYKSPVIIIVGTRFQTGILGRKIEIMLLTFKNEPCGGYLKFRCKNGMCISSCLVCDGYNHCGDNSDEKGEDLCYKYRCPVNGTSNSGAKIGIAISCLLTVATISLAILFAWMKRRVRAREENAANQSSPAEISSDSTTPPIL